MPGQSDLKRAFAEDGALKTHVGGQALIEGVMMRGKFNQRQKEEWLAVLARHPRLPCVRGKPRLGI